MAAAAAVKTRAGLPIPSSEVVTMRTFLYSWILVLALVGCAQTPLVTGRPSAALSPDAVEIFYPRRPACRYEVVAELSASGYVSLASMFARMRRDAATLGADGLYVVHTQQTSMKEFLGSARAIRCLAG